MDKERDCSIVKSEGKMRKEEQIFTAGDKFSDCAGSTSTVVIYQPVGDFRS